MYVSIIIPVFNEGRNITILYKQIKCVFSSFKDEYELIFINDGSYDNTNEVLRDIVHNDDAVKVLSFDKNYGQTAALDAGFMHSEGKFVLTIDADMQYDPYDLLRILDELGRGGADMVLGKRIVRAVSLRRKLFSNIAKFTRNYFIGEHYHDCSLAGYSKACITRLKLYDRLQCFIPALLKMEGFSYKEIDVIEYPRKYGESKYLNTIKLLFDGLFSLYVVRWLKFNKLKYKIVEIIGKRSI